MAILRGRITKPKTNVSQEELFARIQQRAYSLYEKRGYSHSNDWNDWFEAERQVKAELNPR